MQDFKVNLAAAIRQARTERGLTQEKLAEALGLSNRTILDVESGCGNPKFVPNSYIPKNASRQDFLS